MEYDIVHLDAVQSSIIIVAHQPTSSEPRANKTQNSRASYPQALATKKRVALQCLRLETFNAMSLFHHGVL